MTSVVDTSGAAGDRLAADVHAILTKIHAGMVLREYLTERAHQLEVCAVCGSLERANRTCQVCRARRHHYRREAA